jgi:uncharacterized protein (DUF885 family)
MTRIVLFLTLFAVLHGSVTATADTRAKSNLIIARTTSSPYCTSLRTAVTAAATATKKLHLFLDMEWKHKMTEQPETATYDGYPGQNDRWTNYSAVARSRRKFETNCAFELLSKISGAGLKGEDKISFTLAQHDLALAVEGQKFGGEYLVMDQLSGMQLEIADILVAMPAVTRADYDNMLSRLDKVPELAAQTEELLREGLRQHITTVKMFMAHVPGQFDKILTEKVEDSPLYQPFREPNPKLAPEIQAQLQERAKQVIHDKVYPALRKMKDFVVSEYIPGAREKISISDMPNGKEWYAYLVKSNTTTDLTPDQLHELGLKEVERIGKEMAALRTQLKFKGDAKAFSQFLLTDKQFYYTDKTQLMMGFRDIAKRIDPELTKEFKTLPRLTYGVREMPDYKAPNAPSAYYMGGSLEAGRPGYFEANTYDLKARPKWGMEALTLHEAVPGHHLQIALAQELPNLPEFRKNNGYTAFSEGWALYAESLGEELGLFKDPYSKYGQLSYEMWRAIRLVVDSGMHAKGWSRQQAIDYFQAQMPKSKLETEVEVDRYITWPGQALAYKVGQLKFRELRERAQLALGDKFDVREFHDQLLRHGTLPMDVLENVMAQWLETEKHAPSSTTNKENRKL